MKKNVILYFPLKEARHLTHPYQDYESAQQKQEALLACFPDTVELFMARGEKSHISGEIFYPQFKKVGSHWKTYNGEISADLVLGFQIPKGVSKIFNTMSSITRDKTHFEKIFPQYALPSIVCTNYKEIKEKFGSISTPLKVLKPQFGTRSKGVFIQEDIPLSTKVYSENYPYLLQEFHDTSVGFYEFPGIHDFRIVLLNGEIIGKFLRQPQVGKYTANSFRTGNFIDLETWELPDQIEKIINEIEAYCIPRFQHRYYSIDIGQGKNGEIKVFELNSAPGLTNEKISQKLGNYITKNILKIS